MTVRYASLVGYREAVLNGITSQVQRKIVSCLFESDCPMTRRMIEVQTRMRISTVCPAVLSLIESGVIRVAYQDKDPLSGMPADFLEPVWPQPMQRNFDGFDPVLRLAR